MCIKIRFVIDKFSCFMWDDIKFGLWGGQEMISPVFLLIIIVFNDQGHTLKEVEDKNGVYFYVQPIM